MNILYDRGHRLTISYVKECLLFILTKAKRKKSEIKKPRTVEGVRIFH